MMKTFLRKCLSVLCAGIMLLSLLPAGALALRGEGGFLEQSGHLESAYIEWSPVEGATGYRVYIKPADASDSAYTRIDDELVRRYPDCWRADALGLAAGSYVMKVTPVKDGVDMDALVTGPLTVLAQDRSGYAFAGGNVPGAYKTDGTLKNGAKVVYVTDDNKNSVKLGSYTGFQNIVKNADKIGGAIDIRILGKVTGLSNNLVTVQTQTADLTIEGVGSDATAYGWGFSLKSCSRVELRNLGIMLVSGGDHDGVTVEKGKYIWVHNCEFFYNARQDDPEGDKEKGDGSLDTKHSHYASYSYNRFWDTGKCNLQGSGTSDTSDWMTYHHNWYDHSDSRHPRVRVAHVHVFNNYYDHNDQYGIGAVYHATVFADRNYFDNCKYPMLIAQQGSDPGFFTGNGGNGEAGGMMKAYGNIVVGGKYVPWSASNSVEFDAYEVTDPKDTVPGSVKGKSEGWTYDNFDTKSDFYAYTADAAADVPAKVTAYAGRVAGGDFSFDMTKLTDGDKMPNAELLAALEGYTCKLVSVGGGDTGGGETPEPGPGPTPGPDDPIPEIVGGTTYTLTGNEVYALMAAGKGPSSFKNTNSSYPGSYYTSAQTSHKAGTEDFFTLRYAGSSRIDPVPITFPAPDAFEGQYRINFNGYATATQNAVEFTVPGPASVKVWWTGGVAAGESKTLRPMVVLDEGGAVVGTSETVDNSTTPMVSQFSLTDAGTYRLGGKGGKNFIYKVTVTVGSTLGGLPWNLNGDKVTVTGEIPSGEQVWAACWDSADRFLGVHALDARHPETQLDETWARFKLLWLNDKEAPKCSAVEAHK